MTTTPISSYRGQFSSPWSGDVAPGEVQHWLAAADRVNEELAESVVERDRRRELPLWETDLLRTHGLSGLLIPAEYGGGGAQWSTHFAVTERLAAVDGSIAQIYAYHGCHMADIAFYGEPGSWGEWFLLSAEGRWIWGDVVNPVDPTLRLTPQGPERWILEGEKRFCTGAAVGDVSLVLASESGAKSSAPLALVLEREREGVTHIDDWHGLGQRLSDSGSVRFTSVEVTTEDVLGPVTDEPWSTLSTPASQLAYSFLYLGIARGALEAGREATLARPGSWLLSPVDTYAEDPLTQRVYGELTARLSAAQSLAHQTASQFDTVISRGGSLTADERAQIALSIAQLKVVTTETALDITQRIHEVTGASTATEHSGLDLYWRNVRTHTLHDPVDYKKVEIGANYLTGEVQPISLYT